MGNNTMRGCIVAEQAFFWWHQYSGMPSALKLNWPLFLDPTRKWVITWVSMHLLWGREGCGGGMLLDDLEFPPI